MHVCFSAMYVEIYLMVSVAIAILIQQCRCQGECPDGYFGQNCEYRCHCNNSTLCLQSNGDCPVGDTCAFGYFGPGCQYQACPDGFFGQNCEYMCHCANSTLCSKSNGDCSVGDTCAFGYFGPGCQYLDLCGRMTSTSPDYLSDCDDTTCNPHPNERFEKVAFYYTDHFTFFRIVVNNASRLHAFILTMNGNVPCTMERRYPVSATSVDVVCLHLVDVRVLSITGEAAGSLCSIHVSAGRNVALNQRTMQSSNSSTDPERGLSSHAVDGNTRNVYDSNSSCSQTDVESTPFWTVYFNKPVILTNLEVYNRDVFQYKLERFYAVISYKTINLTMARSHRGYHDVYRLSFANIHPVTHMHITLSTTSELTLCEVEAYGEVWCEDGLWGLDCDKPCTCLSNQSCSVVTGTCSTRCPARMYGFKCGQTCSSVCTDECSDRWGLCTCRPGVTSDVCYPDCPAGTYGPNCTLQCPAYCKGGACHYITGRCNVCPGTTYGDRCQFNCSKYCSDKCNSDNGNCSCMYTRLGKHCQDCPMATYGEQCTFYCSKYCINRCHQESGRCICRHGRTGQDCADCPGATYGDQCQLICPKYCSNKCDSVNGNCTCMHHRTGPHCSKCPDGKFGSECSFDCPVKCSKNMCDMTSGICVSCTGNRSGDNCTECPPGYFGDVCHKRCSLYCKNRLCNHETLKCVECVEGFEGDYCQKEIARLLSTPVVIVLLLPLLAVFIVYFVVSRKSSDSNEDGASTIVS